MADSGADERPRAERPSTSALTPSGAGDDTVAREQRGSQHSSCGVGARVRKLLLIGVLVALLIGEGAELRSRGAATQAYQRLNRAFGGEKQIQPLAPAEVRQLVGREPDAIDQAAELEVYRWSGGLKDHALFVQYMLVSRKRYVRDFALDQDPRLQ